MNKKIKNKIINDPIYGFISLEKGIIFELNRTSILSKTKKDFSTRTFLFSLSWKYHTRFHHTLGCMFLMTKAIEQLRNKGSEITDEEVLSH